jgi:competence/damage-inducible protein CinA-like protein
MPTSEIIAIGTELLLGEIQDTNTHRIALFLRNNGIDLYRSTIIGDNTERIVAVIQEAMMRSDIIITSGGLGPTVDDPTREAVARSIDEDLDYLPELWDQIVERFRRFGRTPTPNNSKQAYIPRGAIPVENPVGTAPAFIVDTGKNVIISLPGVPKEMEYLLINSIQPYLKVRFDLHETIKTSILHTAGIGESQIDEYIGDLEGNANPTVGLSAKPGQTDIRITAKADTEEIADSLLSEMIGIIQKRLGDNIYGIDDETLVEVIINKFHARDLQIAIVECGLGGKLIDQMRKANFPILHAKVINTPCNEGSIFQEFQNSIGHKKNLIVLGIYLYNEEDSKALNLFLKDNASEEKLFRSFGGSPDLFFHWIVNMTLDFLRRNI